MTAEKLPYMTAEEAAGAIINIGRKLYEKGMVASNDGNISVRIGDDAVMITPTGVSKGALTREMLLTVTLDGELIAGSAKKSTETAMHLRLYKENPEIRVAVHAHPAFATSFAIAGIALDAPIYPEAYAIVGEVPLAPYATPGTQEVPDSIAPFACTHNAVLLSNHGALTWGKTPEQAYFRMESLEGYARVTMYSKYILGSARELTPDQLRKIHIFN